MEIISYSDLKQRLQEIPNIEHRALLCTIYSVMGREGEVCIGRYKKTQGILGRNIRVFPDCIKIELVTEKTGKTRLVILFRNRESWLIDIILSWRGNNPGSLFPFSTRKAEYVFKKYFPELSASKCAGKESMKSKHTIHWLRGWRYTHYRRGEVTGKKVDSKTASLFGGWVSSAVPERIYDLSSIEDFEEELRNDVL